MPAETIVTEAPISRPRDPFFKLLAKVFDELDEQGFKMKLEEQPKFLGWDLRSWVHRPTHTWLHLWEDYHGGVTYIELKSKTKAALARVREVLVETLKPPSREELVARAGEDRKHPVTLMRAVYCSGAKPDDDTVELVTSALASKSLAMRQTGAYAAYLLGWREFKEPLKRALTKEKTEAAIRWMEDALEHSGNLQRPKVR
jgi:hypothetical protein